jgi:hypothetical protein
MKKKSNEDKLIEAIKELGDKKSVGAFGIIGIFMKHMGDNIESVKLTKERKI